ncbi:DUF952 domain-containing protein [Leptodesmis sp.]|uniref:DUF952 domain-containing protein n=1 Tax=Leptodesmis sp. TaxID=3100501 RepID=UPI0040535341
MLVLLCINPPPLQAGLRYDELASGECFPHLYGPLSHQPIISFPHLPHAHSSHRQ